MKVTGKISKIHWVLLALAGIFLLALGLLYMRAYTFAPGTDYTIVCSRPTEEIVTPKPKGPININTADLDQLMTLKGIGPALAQRILDYRKEHGPFSSVEELLEVKGIGESTLEKFRDHVTIAAPPPEVQEGETAHEENTGGR